MKKAVLVLAVIMMLSLVAGCSPKSKSVDIKVVTAYHSGDGNRTNFVNAVEAYKTATGNTVTDMSEESNEEWKTRVIKGIKDGTGADVLFFFTGADADELVKSGLVVPVSEIRKENGQYASNMKDSMMPVSSADGRQYAVPVNGYWEGLYVNKNVLEAAGVTVPGADYTWDQFFVDCEKIRDAGYTPVACSLGEVPHYWFEFVTFNNGTISNHATLPKSSGDEIGKIWAAGLTDIKELYSNGFLPDDTLTMTDSESCQMFIENKAAFLLDGSWKLGWIQENAADINDFTVTYAPAKGARHATDIVGGLSMGYYITRAAFNDTAKRKACIDFVMAMTTNDVVSSFGALSITALKEGTTPPANADALMSAALQMTKGCTGVVLAVQDGLLPDARNALFADIAKIVTGSRTPEEAIDACLAG